MSTSGYFYSTDRTPMFENLKESCQSLKIEEWKDSDSRCNGPLVRLNAVTSIRTLFTFGASGIFSYDPNFPNCGLKNENEKIDEQSGALISEYDIKGYDGRRLGIYGSEKIILSEDKKFLTYYEIRHVSKPYQDVNYSCKFVRVE